MSVATSPRPKPDAIPDHPGVYLFRDRNTRVIYVGKAISLRKRTASYFQPMRNLHPRTAAMVEASASLEWMLVPSEVEALQLEYNLIKQHRPRYNVRYRDDKSYPWLAVPLADEIPRPRVERGPKRKGTRYFGPYAHAYAIRETPDLLLRTFPMRTCSKGVFDRHRRLGRPCILFDINKCSGPCVGRVSPEGHRRIVEEFVAFMDGRTRPTLQRLEAEMRQAAEQLNFELAARLRDQLASVRKAMERQQMVSSSPEDFDIAAFAEDDLEAAVQVFFVRRGRVVGRRGFVVDKVEALDTPALAATFVQQLYGDRADEVPREIFLPVEPEGAEALREWLAGLRGRPVDFRVPRRGEKRALLETVAANAREAFATHKLKRASDFDARARGRPRPAGGLAGQADGGGLPPRHARPGGHPPDQRGPVSPAAGPRRGPPLRHHLPPQAARPLHDPQRARRHPRGRGDPPPPAGPPFRVGPQGRPGQPGGAGAGSRGRPPAC